MHTIPKPTRTTALLAALLLALGRHWVKLSDAELKPLIHLAKRVAVEETGMTEANRRKLRPFDDRQTVRAFLELPETLMQIAESGKYCPKRAAEIAQAAAATQVLIVRPIRRENLRSLHLDRNFVCLSRHSVKVHMYIAAEDVKNGVPIEHPLEGRPRAVLDRYITHHRKHLADHGNRYLFPAESGLGCKSANAVALQVKRAVWSHLGIDVNLALLRTLVIAGVLLSTSPSFAQVSPELGIALGRQQAACEENYKNHPGTPLVDLVACEDAAMHRYEVALGFPWMDLEEANEAEHEQIAREFDSHKIDNVEFGVLLKEADARFQTALDQRVAATLQARAAQSAQDDEAQRRQYARLCYAAELSRGLRPNYGAAALAAYNCLHGIAPAPLAPQPRSYSTTCSLDAAGDLNCSTSEP